MAKAYKRPSVGGWLAPAMIGPWLSTYSAVSLYAFLGPELPYVNRWVAWGVGMALGTLFAGFYVLTLVLLDVLLLAIRQRALPTGSKAWLMAMGAPLIPLVSYMVMKPWTFWKYGAWYGVAASILVPVLVSGLGARVAFGEKVHANQKSEEDDAKK